MDAIQAIREADQIRQVINRLSHALDLEIGQLWEEWQALESMGSGRADHAVILLSRLRPNLHELAGFCETCESQIDGLLADPFGRD